MKLLHRVEPSAASGFSVSADSSRLVLPLVCLLLNNVYKLPFDSSV